MASPDEKEQFPTPDDDTRRLARLGYKQELSRSWSGFSNFAISFSAISILSGCFTTFGQAWNNGGPIAISLGWPLISFFILLVGLSIAELASAYPTSGGIYWWASKMGGARAGFYAGWFNLVGLLAVTASVVYGAATFLNTLLGSSFPVYATTFLQGDFIKQQFFWFVLIMVTVTLFNCLRSSIQAKINNISVGWHVAGSLLVVLVLWLIPQRHQSLHWVFTATLNNSGFSGQRMFWFYVMPLGFLLTQYTITGFDASAHLSEETRGAHLSAARGIWKSIFFSAVGGYVLLISFLFAATRPEVVSSFDQKINPYGSGSVIALLENALTPIFFRLVLLASAGGQLFCSVACLTSCSRMLFAFSRDGAVPGHRLWSAVNKNHVPVKAVVASAIAGIAITLPALWKSPRGIPTAFYAVVSIGVIGLYIALLIPIWFRLRAGTAFKVGEWNLGKQYRWINILAVLEILVVCVYFMMPFEPAAIPWNKDFTWLALNYAPLLVGITFFLLWLWWKLSVRKWFKGPIRQFE